MQCYTHNHRKIAYLICLALAASVSGCSCDGGSTLSKTCPLPRPCIVLEDETVRELTTDWKKDMIGQCRQGMTQCTDDYETICVGYAGPQKELCDQEDNDCDGFIDEDFDEDGDTYTTCEGDCNDHDVGERPGHPELCDGKDNDCDGDIDEDLEPVECFSGRSAIDLDTTICSSGFRYCRAGRWSYCEGEVVPSPETCNGIDDDCDGEVDEYAIDAIQCGTTDLGRCEYGHEICIDSEYICHNAIYPQNETCNGYDDDCDGMVDEELYRPCSSICGQGLETCDAGTWTDCSATQPEPELCDLIDNDCDGETDEGCSCIQGETSPCQATPVTCGLGIMMCDAQGTWGPCQPFGTEPEICDNWDNDCDGIVDGFSQTCGDPTRAGIGTCQLGTSTCSAGMWTACVGAVNAETEICDMLDNDCDGLIDEDLNPHDKVDMVFAIDTSGSMCGVIGAVAQGISSYVSTFAGTDHRFALVEFPPAGHIPWRTQGLVGVSTFAQTLANLGCTGGGFEPSYDVVLGLASLGDPVGIGWRADAYPYIILVTDEPAQSWMNTSEATVAAATSNCQTGACVSGDRFEMYVITPSSYWFAWDDVTFGEAGRLIDLRPINAARYTQMLSSIFQDVCR